MPSSNGLGGQIYTLNFTNNSERPGDLCVFQQDPSITDPTIFSLAWFALPCNPGSSAKIQWTIDYSFVWEQTGTLIPGVIFDATQVVPADLNTSNTITLDYVNGGYEFADQGEGTAGTLFIKETPNVLVNNATVGIGMSGSGTFVTQAGPNLTAMFTPHPEYWVAFGTFQPGQVLDVTVINNPAQVAYPPGVYSMTALLNEQNLWSIQPTMQASLARRPAALAR